jgi:hypothetical protein
MHTVGDTQWEIHSAHPVSFGVQAQLTRAAPADHPQWDEAKHPQRRPLKETVDNLGSGVVQLEDDLKVSLIDTGPGPRGSGARRRNTHGR